MVGAGSLQIPEQGFAQSHPASASLEASLGLCGEHRPPVAAVGRLCPVGARHPLPAPTPGRDAGHPHREGILGAHSEHPRWAGMLGAHSEDLHQAGMLGAYSKHPQWAGMLGAHSEHPHQERMPATHSEHPHQAEMLGTYSEHPQRAGMLSACTQASELLGSPMPQAMPWVAVWGGDDASSLGLSLCPLALCHADPVPAPVTAPSALPQIPRLSPCPSSPRRCRRARGSCSPAWRPPTPRSKATGEGPAGPQEVPPQPPGLASASYGDGEGSNGAMGVLCTP